MKNQKNSGITLIALVITIVVLVILVGVSVSVAINTGLIANSKTAVADYDKAQTQEQGHISEVEDIVAGYSSKDIMASKVTSANYGNTVTGYTVGEGEYAVSDWQIFSVEGNNVWLISKNYVKLDETTAAAVGMHVIGKLTNWLSAPDFGKNFANGNCAASLADTSKWTAYVDDELALKAMGGPTIEMFTKSYNAKYPSTTLDYELVTTDTNEGYRVKWSTDTEFPTYISGLIQNDGLYISLDSGCDGYWLASASASNNIRIMRIQEGMISMSNHSYNPGYGIRPVVCLRSDVAYSSSTTDGVTTWTLGE